MEVHPRSGGGQHRRSSSDPSGLRLTAHRLRTAHLKLAVPTPPRLSRTVITTFQFPVLLNVPVMRPVLEEIASPLGSAAALNVIGSPSASLATISRFTTAPVTSLLLPGLVTTGTRLLCTMVQVNAA